MKNIRFARGYTMQHEITKVQKLLDKKGHVSEPGWARKPYWQYDRRDIKVPSFRIKEWDYYLAVSDTFAAAFTLSDLGYIGMVSVSLIDLTTPGETTQTVLTPLPMGRMGLRAASASGDADFRNDRVHLRYTTKPGMRRVQCRFRDFRDGQTLNADLVMRQPDMDSICIATPWKEEKTAFYYNQKVNCMPVKGKVTIGEQIYRFNPHCDMAVLDWGRGVWTYDNIWYWGTCSARIGGVPFGFNLGYGFSDRSSATENAVFYDNRLHKLGNVTLDIPENEDGTRDYMKTWGITSDDGRFEAIFVPVIDRQAKIDMKIFGSDQHQIFGHITGTAVLDDGTEVKMREIPAAFECIHNRY